MGYHDYSELSYVRMNRIGYGPEEIQRFRDQVAHDVVPELQKVIASRPNGPASSTPRSVTCRSRSRTATPSPSRAMTPGWPPPAPCTMS